MRFELLEFLEGADVWITVIETDDKSHGNHWLFLFQVIQKGATIRVFVKRPSDCVFYEAGTEKKKGVLK